MRSYYPAFGIVARRTKENSKNISRKGDNNFRRHKKAPRGRVPGGERQQGERGRLGQGREDQLQRQLEGDGRRQAQEDSSACRAIRDSRAADQGQQRLLIRGGFPASSDRLELLMGKCLNGPTDDVPQARKRRQGKRGLFGDDIDAACGQLAGAFDARTKRRTRYLARLRDHGEIIHGQSGR